MASKDVDDKGAQHWERFSDIEVQPCRKLLPIQGYAEMPLVSLEEAVKPLVSIVHDVEKMAGWAKWKCEDPPPNDLTKDQSAAIILYSMEWAPQQKCLYFVLNAMLRDENRQKLKPWFSYLKLFLTGLSRLPPVHRTVYRGIRGDMRQHYKKGQTVIWWGFSSCTLTMDVLANEQFFGSEGTRTLFAIESDSGRDIRQHSAFQIEDEVLLPAARQFEVVSCLPQGKDLYIVQLRETKSPVCLVELVPQTTETTSKPTPSTSLPSASPVDSMSKLTVKDDENVIPLRGSSLDIHPNARWQQNGLTVAGGNGQGSGLNQLNTPCGLYVDDDQTVYVADQMNHRIMEWKVGATSGQVVAGGNGEGSDLHQLHNPTDVIVDKERDCLIICDILNSRVVRWPLRNGTSGEMINWNINCRRLTMDESGSLYISDEEKHEVRRYRRGKSQGTVVAGGNGNGNGLHQLCSPRYIFVDRDHSVYVCDAINARVVKWEEGAKEGIVVAGGQGHGDGLTQLSYPAGVVVDQLGTVYVTDGSNARIMRWPKGATQGSIIIGGNGEGKKSNQLYQPINLSFDRHGNLYIVEYGNHRVQKFTIDSNA